MLEYLGNLQSCDVAIANSIRALETIDFLQYLTCY